MKHKKTIVIGVIVLAVVLIISALSNSTYALFSSDVYGANTNAYSTGMLSIEASSKTENISLSNVLPITDEEGILSNPYVFTIKNTGNLDYKFNVVLSTGDSATTFSSQYIKLQIDDGDVLTLSDLSGGVIKSDITLLAGESIDISIRVWLSIDTPNSEIGKSFSSKIMIDGQAVYTSNNNELNINAAQYITSLYSGAEKTVITNNGIEYNQAQSVSLMNDRLGGTTVGYDGGNIRYYGSNPDNYIYFNCSDYNNPSDETCELWRIIGVFDGKVKIIRDESIEALAWDYDYNDEQTATTYFNNWENSSLQLLLNSSYYAGSSEKIIYYSLRSTGPSTISVNITIDMNSIGLKNLKTRDMLSESTWYLGGYRNGSLYSNDMYNYERTNIENTTVYSGNPFLLNLNIGLMYVSDYGYAADLRTCSKTLEMYYSDTTNCTDTNWLFNASNQWVISQNPESAYFVMSVSSQGGINTNGGGGMISAYEYDVRPTVYLNSDVKIYSGNGSEEYPYLIK